MVTLLRKGILMGIEDFSGRGAVVVGGGSGIGRGIALSLAAEGAQVLIADIDVDSANAVRDEIVKAGGDALAVQADATNDDSLAKVADHAASELGRLHVLIHTVGIISDAPVKDSSEETWAWYTEFNLMAGVRVMKAFLPLLHVHEEGRHVVVTASLAGWMSIGPDQAGGLNIGVYTVLKHAMLAYGEMLRVELAPDGIGVSTLCPGVVNTNLDATSAKNRPERFGGPMSAPKELDLPTRMQPEAVGPIVLRGIRANRPYIFTHPEMVDMVRAYKIQPALDDFAFYAGAAVS